MRYKRGPTGWPVDEHGKPARYWDIRKELIYYSTLANMVRIVGHQAQSVIDIGSAGCHYIKWFDWIPDRVSLDLNVPTVGEGLRSIKADFFAWDPDKVYDVVICSQVLEHIEDATTFARKLLTVGKNLIISVPHKWRAGGIKGHVHDPVDQAKVDQWFGRQPDYSFTVREPFAEERLICFYNIGGARLPSDIGLIVASHPIRRDQ